MKSLPRFRLPDCGPKMFLALVILEFDEIEKALIAQDTVQSEPLQRLRQHYWHVALHCIMLAYDGNVPIAVVVIYTTRAFCRYIQ